MSPSNLDTSSFRRLALFFKHLALLDRRKTPASLLRAILVELAGALYLLHDRVFSRTMGRTARRLIFNSLRWTGWLLIRHGHHQNVLRVLWAKLQGLADTSSSELGSQHVPLLHFQLTVTKVPGLGYEVIVGPLGQQSRYHFLLDFRGNAFDQVSNSLDNSHRTSTWVLHEALLRLRFTAAPRAL